MRVDKGLTGIVGHNVRMLRTYFRLTQQELGDAIGHTKSSIGTIENSVVSTRIEVVDRIAQAFGIDPQLLFQQDGYREITGQQAKIPLLHRIGNIRRTPC